ncbi:MAG TPA: UDP-3-O-(3-hydroxymyristoyl)glucosamine N-acyltransferase [Candidatus Dormibacteraeota bacterium]|nr:UDP-3-O-(3-hydroxymyristoyl)glucosamine N-acyltransferase [Candidatus Dormibacteraeota bacterium]
MKLGELAARLGCTLEGDAEVEIHGVAGIEQARPGQVTFLSNPRYSRELSKTSASAVLVDHKAVIQRESGQPPLFALRSANPYLDFARTIEFFHAAVPCSPEIHPTAVVAKTAKIGAGSHIGPHCFVDEGVEIGRNAMLHSLVTIYRNTRIGDDFLAHSQTVVRENCTIGNRVILQNGVVIGGDGFGFAKHADGSWHKILQLAPVVIEDDVEIQSNSCIDRATVGETRIRRGAKIDDLVLVGHACEVGEDAILCGQVGLAGSTRVGNRAILAGQVGSAGHLEIGDAAVVTAQSGMHLDVPAGAVRSGSPVMENKLYLKVIGAMKRLPEMQKTLRHLAGEIERLKMNEKQS